MEAAHKQQAFETHFLREKLRRRLSALDCVREVLNVYATGALRSPAASDLSLCDQGSVYARAATP